MSAFAITLLVGACAAHPGAGTGQHPDQVGATVVPAAQRQPAPNLSGTTLSGARFDLADHIGRSVVMVNVWASWCEPCRQEIPLLVRAASAAPGVRPSIVGIDERDDTGSARAFSSSLGITYPSLVDTKGEILRQLPSLPQDAVPSTIFIDTDGMIAARVIGQIDSGELHSILSQLPSREPEDTSGDDQEDRRQPCPGVGKHDCGDDRADHEPDGADE